jgi:multiple sugar transport system ATP-binding protein
LKIELINISKAYGDFQAVKNINLEIDENEFVVLLGPSGCGKSTTLRMIAGLEEISGGDLIIDGKKSNDIHPKNRNIGMVFQNYALYPHMSVFNNLAFPLKINKSSKKDISAKVNEVAKIVDLSEPRNRLIEANFKHFAANPLPLSHLNIN